MTGLCGWVLQEAGAGIDLSAMTAGLPQPLPSMETCFAGKAALAAPQSQIGQEGMLLAAYTGQPQWKDPYLQEVAGKSGHAAALMTAWRDMGAAFVEKLSGRFSVAVLDGDSGAGIVATDRIGSNPIAYGECAGGVAFGSSVQAVRGAAGVDDSIPTQAIYTFLFYYIMPAPMSIYAGVSKLRAAECLDVRDGRGAARIYHPMHYARETSRSVEDLAEELRGRLAGAVDSAVEGLDEEKTGAFLSGGLDSSTVAGLFARRSSAPAKTFTIGFDEEGYDESGYARIVANAFGTDHHEYYVTPADVAALLPRMAATFDEPFGNSSAIPAYYCAKVARDAGVTTMLAGDGGDELFAGNERYLSMFAYDWYTRLPAFLRRGLLEPAAGLPGISGLNIARKLKGLARFTGTPLPDRLFAFDYFAKEPVAEIFDEDTLSELQPDAVLDLVRESYLAPVSGSPVQRLMHMDTQVTLADNDLRKVNGMATLAGIDIRYPMLDDGLIDFAATIPEEVLLKNGVLRGFYKETFGNFLPREVIEKSKHGFGLPFARWLKSDPQLKEMADAALQSFGRRNIIRGDFLHRVMRSHHQPEDTIVDRFVWDIMVLEMWFQKWH